MPTNTKITLAEQEILEESYIVNRLISAVNIISNDLIKNFGNWQKNLKSKDAKKIQPILKQIDTAYNQLEAKTDRLKQLLNNLNNAKTVQEKEIINKILQQEFPPLPATPTLNKQKISGLADLLKQKVATDPTPSQVLDNFLDQILNKYGMPEIEYTVDLESVNKFIEDFKINENHKEKNKMLISESRLKEIIIEELQAELNEGVWTNVLSALNIGKTAGSAALQKGKETFITKPIQNAANYVNQNVASLKQWNANVNAAGNARDLAVQLGALAGDIENMKASIKLFADKAKAIGFKFDPLELDKALNGVLRTLQTDIDVNKQLYQDIESGKTKAPVAPANIK